MTADAVDVHVFLLAGRLPSGDDTATLAAARHYALTAELAGFAGVWIAEHHFIPYGVCPSAVAFAAHVLGATKRIAVGTAAAILSNRHPVALGEERCCSTRSPEGGSDSGWPAVDRGSTWRCSAPASTGPSTGSPSPSICCCDGRPACRRWARPDSGSRSARCPSCHFPAARCRPGSPPHLLEGTRAYVRIDGSTPAHRDLNAYVEHLIRIGVVGSARTCRDRLAASVDRTGIRHVLLMIEAARDPGLVRMNLAALARALLPASAT